MNRDFIALDIGNTSVAVGYFRDRRLIRSFYVASDPNRSPDEYGVLLRQLLACGGVETAFPLPSVMCSVVPVLTAFFREGLMKYFGQPPAVVGPGSEALGMEVSYVPVGELGADRFINALAARELYGTPAVVIDFGTATTYDVVGASGRYEGGVIAPGVALSAKTLFEKAALLGPVPFTMPERVIGRTTGEALRAGIVLGAAATADGIVDAIWRELGQRGYLIATGGLSPVVCPHMRSRPVADRELTLKGLALAFERVRARDVRESV